MFHVLKHNYTYNLSCCPRQHTSTFGHLSGQRVCRAAPTCGQTLKQWSATHEHKSQWCLDNCALFAFCGYSQYLSDQGLAFVAGKMMGVN
jgi:hypothetical protein